MEIKIKNRTVIANGTVVSQGDEDILFGFSDKVNLKFEFISSEEKDGPQLVWRIENETTLVGRLCGFGVAQGAFSNREPMEVGTLNGKKFFLNFALNYIGTAENYTRIFHYTFFQTDGAD